MIPIRPSSELLAQPYWQYLVRGVLKLNFCHKCDTYRHPPGPVCPKCRTIGNEWAAVSGRGALKSYTTVYHPVHKLLADHTPYIITLVELEEGVRMVSGIPAGLKVELKVGMPLQCRVMAIDNHFALPFFLPIGTEHQ